MIDHSLLRTDRDRLFERLSRRVDVAVLEELASLDERRRTLTTETDKLRTRRKQLSEHIGQLKRSKEPADTLLAEVDDVKKRLGEQETELAEIEQRFSHQLLRIPNVPDETTPIGSSEEDNVVVRTSGTPASFPFAPRPHWEIGEHLGILDFETGARLSGSRFVALKGMGARLERALISFMLGQHISRGYRELSLPYLVTRESITGTGQLPKFADEVYACEADDLFLIPTAEVTLMNVHRGQTLDEQILPLRYVSHSACFRRESGSYGKDTKGLIRNHQFHKIELVHLTAPEASARALEQLTADAEHILASLELPYRVVALCTGDMGFSAAKTYDLEVWMPGENRWREISSCSNCTDFQARRLGIRMKRHDGKKCLVHSLNGSGVAVGRTLACILETFQQEDGSVLVPAVLRSFVGTDRIVPGQ
jgi:seryl-tRNA synthetase